MVAKDISCCFVWKHKLAIKSILNLFERGRIVRSPRILRVTFQTDIQNMRPERSLFMGYAVLDNIYYEKFLRYYYLKRKNISNNNLPDVLTEELNESNLSSSFSYQKFISLMKSNYKLHC